jgi:hypothetical protein
MSPIAVLIHSALRYSSAFIILTRTSRNQKAEAKTSLAKPPRTQRKIFMLFHL